MNDMPASHENQIATNDNDIFEYAERPLSPLDEKVRPNESTFDFEQLQNELNSASVKVTKNFQCDICKRSFATKLKIKKHMTIHIERPYDCKVCDKAFSREITLVRHIRKHTGEKPFNCNVCNEKFSLKRYLKVHTNTHK